jgi:hypothetical protein
MQCDTIQRDWSVEQVSANTARMRVTYQRNQDWQFYVLLTADRHIDHALSDLSMQHRHLRLAQEGGYPVVDIGDLFCAMQGKRDPRSSRKALLDRLNQREEYMDALVDYAHEVLGPYSDVLALLGLGNHETGALKNNETHLLNRLVDRLNDNGSSAVLGGYQGWLKMLFESEAQNNRQSINIRYTHGGGADAPVTKGTIQSSRRAVIYPDAHVVISGHSHNQWMMPIPRLRLNNVGREVRDEQLHLQIPSYKDEITGQVDGFAVEKQHAPKPMGAWWLKFWWEKDKGLRYDAMRAV